MAVVQGVYPILNLQRQLVEGQQSSLGFQEALRLLLLPSWNSATL